MYLLLHRKHFFDQTPVACFGNWATITRGKIAWQPAHRLLRSFGLSQRGDPVPNTRASNARSDHPASGGDRRQFSISMKPEMRAKVETLAGLRHMSMSDYIGMVMEAHLAAIPSSTWEQIRTLEDALKSQGIKFKSKSEK